jgi:predicted nucleic acid-binding Zn ribbon protein
MKTAPYYPFTPPRTPTGCAAHNDVECLCDVVIGTPAPIMTEAPHPWLQAAVDTLDHYQVDARNLYDVFSVAMGLFTLNDLMFGPGRDEHRPAGPAVWRNLSDDVRLALRNHYRVGSPWEHAVLELDGLFLPETSVNELRRYYVERRRTASYERNSTKARERHLSRAKTHRGEAVANCVWCGCVIDPVGGKKSCSRQCRQALYHSRRAPRRKGVDRG